MVFKKILNGILALLLLIGALGNYQSPIFTAWAAVLIVAAAVLGRHHPRRVLLPALLVIGTFASSAAASAAGWRWLLAAAAAAVFYLIQRQFPKELSHHWEETAVLFIAALVFVGIWSLNFYFPLFVPWYGLLLAGAALFLSLMLHFTTLSYALPGTLVLLEIQWALLYWPTHFLTTAAVHFTAFYLLYIFHRLNEARRLHRRQAYFQFITAGTFLLIVLLTSPWP